MKAIVVQIFLLFILGFSNTVDAQDTTLIYTFQLKEEIAPSAFRTVKHSIAEAEEMNADYLIMELNTYGGLVDSADSIRTALLRTNIPTISFINNNAASAGSLISIACDSIYMTGSANMGASSVVDGTGQLAPDKYQSYMRSTMRSTAEETGRDPKIAEAMVDASIEIPGVVDEGKILTFTATEAINNGYCEGKAESLTDLIENQLDIDNYTVKKYVKTPTERFISFLLHPIVSSVLMFMMIGGIWFEIQTPGLGVPLIAAIIGAILYFMPLYVEGLVSNWEIIILIVGIALIAIEVFVIPGFGVSGVLGILCIVTGLTFSLVHNELFEFTPKGFDMLTQPFARVIFSLLAVVVTAILVTPFLFKTSSFKNLALQTEASKDRGFTVMESKLNDVIGKEAVVVNELKPMGRVEIDGDFYAARSNIGWVDKGEFVKVVEVDVNNLVVSKINKA